MLQAAEVVMQLHNVHKPAREAVADLPDKCRQLVQARDPADYGFHCSNWRRVFKVLQAAAQPEAPRRFQQWSYWDILPFLTSSTDDSRATLFTTLKEICEKVPGDLKDLIKTVAEDMPKEGSRYRLY